MQEDVHARTRARAHTHTEEVKELSNLCETNESIMDLCGGVGQKKMKLAEHVNYRFQQGHS